MKNKIIFSFFLLLIGIKANSQVTVTSSDSVNCTTLCTTLTAHLVGDAPTNAGITIDDTYPLAALPIGFTFNFYGTNYTQCLIGPNGTVGFDVSLVGGYADYIISGPLAGDPVLYNTIAGPYCDIDVAYGGIITYSTTGTAPYRKYIITFCNDHMYSCTSQVTSSQIILYETTNLVEVHIGTKTSCPWNGGYAIIGVQNATGTASTAAPGRDFPSVYTCTNEAWRFTPDATFANYAVSSIAYAPIPLATATIYWYNVTTGAYMGTGTTQVVCPTTTTTYKAGGLGCADTSFGYYTVVPSGSITATYTAGTILVCGGTTNMTIGGLTPGLSDTVHYTFNGVPQPPFIGIVSAGGTLTIPGILAGSYTNIYATQGACSSVPGALVVAPPPITISVLSSSNPSVCGYSDGSITLTGYTPSTAYSVGYTFNGTPVAASGYTSSGSGTITIPGLSAGTYTNFVSTGGPCPPSAVAGPVVLTDPPPPVVTVDSAFVKTCVGVGVQLHAYATPVGVPYTYSWSPATDLSNPNISNPVVTPAAVGNVNYVVTVNPSPTVPACASTANVTVHAIGDFVVGPLSSIICIGQSVNVTNTGSAEITYAWTPTTGVVPPNSATPVITPTAGGNYTYTVHGSYANCPDYVHTIDIHVDVPTTATTIFDTICVGMTEVFDYTATSSAYYHYQWTYVTAPGLTFSNDTLPNPVITATAAGTYTINATVTPLAASCGTTNVINMLVLPNVITLHPTDTAICAGQVVQVIGIGDPLFTYQWLPTAGIAGSTVLNTLITPDTSALYTVTASFHRCPDIHATLNLVLQPNPSVYIGGNRPLCQFDTVHLNASVSPAWYSGYAYSWTPSADLDHNNTPTVVFSGATTTNLHLVVTTSAGCKGEDSALITVYPGNFLNPIPDQEFCPHQSATLLTGTTQPGVTYTWYPSLYLDDSTSASPVITPIASQTYMIIGTTLQGCKDTVSFTASVFPDAVIMLGDSVTLYPGESYHISPITNCVSFAWFPPSGLNSTTIADPTATPDFSTQYVVTAITEHGCIAKDSISIYVSEESLLGMPNAFVPGTGDNKEFKVILRGIARLNYFRIYNRWGNLLFETKDITKGWDGAFKGEPQPLGVYVYDVQAVTNTGKVVNKRGNITLLR